MLIHVIFKIIKPYHTHITPYQTFKVGPKRVSFHLPGKLPKIAHLQGRKNGCPALRHRPWGPRTSSPRGTSGPSWWGSMVPAVPAPGPPAISSPGLGEGSLVTIIASSVSAALIQICIVRFISGLPVSAFSSPPKRRQTTWMVTFVGILFVDVGDILGIICFLWMILIDFLDECLDMFG